METIKSLRLIKQLKNLFLIASPLVVSLSLNQSSILAATFASSETSAFTENFSNNPQGIFTTADTSTLATSINSLVNTNAFATAFISSSPASSQNYSLSAASGLGNNYFGLAQSNSSIGGFNFSVQEQKTFSFDFGALLNLKTSTDRLDEQANASGNISFLLFDSSNQDNWSVLDYFQISGNLSASGNVNPIAFNKSSDAFNYSVLSNVLESNSKSASTVKGSYSRYFSTTMQLSLVEFKNTQAIVATPVPVPSSLFGGVCFGLFFVYKVIKRKKIVVYSTKSSLV